MEQLNYLTILEFNKVTDILFVIIAKLLMSPSLVVSIAFPFGIPIDLVGLLNQMIKYHHYSQCYCLIRTDFRFRFVAKDIKRINAELATINVITMVLISITITFHCWKSKQIVVITAIEFSKEAAIQIKKKEKKGNSLLLFTSIEIIAKKTIIIVVVIATVVVAQINLSAIIELLKKISANKFIQLVQRC